MRIPATGAHNRWHPEIEPVAVVAPGDVVTLETRDGLDGQLTRESTHADCARFDDGLAHPLTGPLFVDGADAGDVLEVELLEYATPAFGVNCVIPGFGFLADVFTEPFLVPWELDGAVARSTELPGIAVPACVHAGVDRPGAVARADGGAAGAGGADPRGRRRRRRRRPRVRDPAERGGRASHDPAARDRRQHGHPPARRRLDAAASGARARRAALARRRPLRAGRRRGVRHGDRDRVRGDDPRRAPQGAAVDAALPGLRDAS